MAGGMIGESVPAGRSDLLTRAIAGIVMILVALTCLWLGGVAFWLLAAAAMMVMLAEWAGLMRAGAGRTRLALAAFAIPVAFACPLVAGVDRNAVALLVTAAIVVVLASGGGRLGMGLLYAGLPGFGLLFLRGLPGGIALTLWTLAIVWATDIGAYFAGRAIGGPKLAPALSPSKTWAGLGGGVAAAAATGALIATLTGLPPALALLGGPLAVLAQIGDLFESWLKRRAGVKDSGRILPGHGGALDRLDGVAPVAALVAGLFAAGLL